MAQSVKHPTLDFRSGHDLMACEFEPMSGSVLTALSLEPASDSVSASLSAPSPLALCFLLSKINIRKKKKEEVNCRV